MSAIRLGSWPRQQSGENVFIQKSPSPDFNNRLPVLCYKPDGKSDDSLHSDRWGGVSAHNPGHCDGKRVQLNSYILTHCSALLSEYETKLDLLLNPPQVAIDMKLAHRIQTMKDIQWQDTSSVIQKVTTTYHGNIRRRSNVFSTHLSVEGLRLCTARLFKTVREEQCTQISYVW